jgi:hypothetical protein
MPKARNYAREYATYQGKPSQIKDRAQRNAARAKMEQAGAVHKGDGKDVHHKAGLSNARGNLSVRSKSANRADHT